MSVATCQTAMRSILGQIRIFAPHVPNYVVYSAPLDNMTSKQIVWDHKTWSRDYFKDFAEFKDRLKTAMILFSTDYSLDWIL